MRAVKGLLEYFVMLFYLTKFQNVILHHNFVKEKGLPEKIKIECVNDSAVIRNH